MNKQFDLPLLMPVILNFPVNRFNDSSIMLLMFTLESILYIYGIKMHTHQSHMVAFMVAFMVAAYVLHN